MNRVVKQTRDATINMLTTRRMFRHSITLSFWHMDQNENPEHASSTSIRNAV